MHTISSIAASNVGNVRENNEDNFFINGKTLDLSIQGTVIERDESSRGLFAVCDGMGGEASGEVASAIAVNTLQEYYKKMRTQETQIDETIGRYADNANALICAEIEKNGGKRMGTTFAVLYIKDNLACVYNIGDSRVYLLRNNQLIQISQDHTQIKRLVDMGILTAEKAREHPERHKLTQHLGIFPEEMVIEPFIAEPITIMENDTFLLCSDGLSDMLDDKEIEEIMISNSKPADVSSKLMDAALENGGKDNITIIISKIGTSKSIAAKLKQLIAR